MNRIIIGAGETRYEGWTSTQEKNFNILDFDNMKTSCELESVDAFLAEHVWEHMTYEDGIIAARNCFKFLKPGGYVRCAVPDLNFNNEWYQNMVQVGGPGPKDHPAYSHKILYDYQQLIKVFEQAGFDVELLEYCDEKNNFNYKYWNPLDGYIGRSFRFDTRNSNESLGMVSIIIDAKKKGFVKGE